MQGEEGGLLSPTSCQKPLTLQVIISLPLSLFLTFIHKSFWQKETLWIFYKQLNSSNVNLGQLFSLINQSFLTKKKALKRQKITIMKRFSGFVRFRNLFLGF